MAVPFVQPLESTSVFSSLCLRGSGSGLSPALLSFSRRDRPSFPRRWAACSSVARACPPRAFPRRGCVPRLTRRSSERPSDARLLVLRRHGPSLSLGPLGPESLAWGSSMESAFQFLCQQVHPLGQLVPSFTLSRRQRPSFPRRWVVLLLRRPEALCRRGPNHALQRTGHGGHVFSVFFVLRRHDPSLSLSPLGALPLCSVFERRVCSRSLRGQRLFPFVPSARSPSGSVGSFVRPFPAAAPVIPPPVGSLSSVPQIPKSRA